MLYRLALHTIKTLSFLYLIGISLLLIFYVTELQRKNVAHNVLALRPFVPQELRLLNPDWLPPRIGLRTQIQDAIYDRVEFSISSDREVELQNASDLDMWKLEFQYTKDDKYYYALVWENSKKEATSLEYELEFAAENSETNIKEFELKRPQSQPSQQSQPEIITLPAWKDPKYYITADDLLAFVDREYRIAQDYIPKDLLILSQLGIENILDQKLRQDAAIALQKMATEMRAQGFDYVVTSGYRTFADQLRIYRERLDLYNGNADLADRVSARPGYSDHQLGTALDIVSSENGYMTRNAENTRMHKWMLDNAHSFGFVLPYGPVQNTGFNYEPWHWRYIGVENAAKYRDSNLQFWEWLKLQNKFLDQSNVEVDD